jgi:hypothetical protein
MNDHWVAWRLRNRRVDPATVETLATAWTAGAAPPGTAVPVTTVPTEVRHLERNPRMELVRRRVTEPGVSTATLADASPGDVAYAERRFDQARDAYAREVAEHPDRIAAWVGLALAAERTGDAAAAALRAAPEVVLAVHRRLAAVGEAPDPLALCRWSAAVTTVSTDDADQVGGGSTTQ